MVKSKSKKVTPTKGPFCLVETTFQDYDDVETEVLTLTDVSWEDVLAYVKKYPGMASKFRAFKVEESFRFSPVNDINVIKE